MHFTHSLYQVPSLQIFFFKSVHDFERNYVTYKPRGEICYRCLVSSVRSHRLQTYTSSKMFHVTLADYGPKASNTIGQ